MSVDNPIKIIYFGTPEFSAHFLRAFLDDPRFQVVGLVCQPDEPVGRKQILTAPATKQVVEEYNREASETVPVFQPTKLKPPEFENALRELGADLSVVVAYGRIIPQAILDIPRLGTLNLHPSLLPLYRGPSPMQAALVAGDKQTGVTIMKLDVLMDHGPILAQAMIDLTADDNIKSLTETVKVIGAELLLDSAADYAAGSLIPAEQDHDRATLCHLLTRADGMVDPAVESSSSIINKFRAYYPWPGVSIIAPLVIRSTEGGDRAVKKPGTTVKLHDLKVTDEVITGSNEPGEWIANGKTLFIKTVDRRLIEIKSLQPEAGKVLTASEFISGYTE